HSIAKSNSIRLRNYQKECIESTINGLNSGITRQAISLPVGSGKTVVMAHLIPQIPTFIKGGDKVLVLAHRQELLFQAFRTIKNFNPKLRIDIERGRHQCDIDNTDVILVSVQSLGYNNSKRLTRFHKEKFKCVIIDEAHHSSAITYLRILNHFGLIKNEEENNLDSNKINNKILLWGCSATLRRHDGVGLSKIFDKIIYHKDFFEMVKEGWLCDIKATTIKTEIDLSNVGYVLGDYNQTQLATAIDTEERNNLIIHGYRRLASKKSTIIFALNIQHATNLEKKFKFWKIECEVISSQTRLELRQEYIENFRIGKLKVLINCTILTEGLDIPNIDCIIMARPTKSKPLYQQMLGRGMRKHTGKKECLILDFVDVQKDKTLCSIPTLLGMDYNLILKEQKISQLIEKKEKMKEKEKEEKEKKEEEKKKVVLPNFIKNIQLIHYDNLNHINFIQNQTKRKEDNMGDFDWVMLDENCFVLNLLNGQIRIEKEDSKLNYINKT
ncbi:P-loop containing nucleoside triphosphate hydrolase protein, partial [Neoconidiobolus thromboides FSU 785]